MVYLLPSWLLLISATSVFNTVACYTSKDLGRRVYQGPASAGEVTDLSARLFGIWTLLSSVVRTYAAYNIASKDLYAVAFWSYAIALVYFCSEWLFYGTTMALFFAVASTTVFWMVAQWTYYTTSE